MGSGLGCCCATISFGSLIERIRNCLMVVLIRRRHYRRRENNEFEVPMKAAREWPSLRTLGKVMVALLAILHSVSARDVDSELEQVNKGIQEHRERRADVAVVIRQLNSRIEKLPAKAPERMELQKDLEALQQLPSRLVKEEQELQARVQTIQNSAEYRIPKAIGGDKRRPTKAKISGVWTSGPNLTGYTVQLEQRGDLVEGRGYYWGCLGIYDIFNISGTYRGDTLSLTFDKVRGKREEHVYRYNAERGRPRFEVRNSKYEERIVPVSGLR
jgi:hypothetical protein